MNVPGTASVDDSAAVEVSRSNGPTIAPTGYQLAATTGPLEPNELRVLDAWWRAANYLSVGQIYLD